MPSSELAPLVGRAGELAELRRLLSERAVVVVCGPAGIGKSALAGAALAPTAIWIDLAGAATAEAIRDRTARALGLERATGDAAALASQLERMGATVVWEDAPAPALELASQLSEQLRAASAARLLLLSREAPRGDAGALELAALPPADGRALVAALDARNGPSLYDQIAALAGGNPGLVELALQAAHEHLCGVAEGLATRLAQTSDPPLAAATTPEAGWLLPSARVEALIRAGDLSRAAIELARLPRTDSLAVFHSIAMAVLPSLRGDTRGSRQLLRRLRVPAGAEGDRAAAFVLSYCARSATSA